MLQDGDPGVGMVEAQPFVQASGSLRGMLVLVELPSSACSLHYRDKGKRPAPAKLAGVSAVLTTQQAACLVAELSLAIALSLTRQARETGQVDGITTSGMAGERHA